MKQRKLEIFLSCFFAFLTLLGYSYKMIDSWDLILATPIKNIFLFVIYTFVYLIVILFLEKIFYKIGINKNENSKIFDKHPLLIPMLILFLCWLPWLIIKYPGSPGWDFYYMLNYFHGLETGLTQHFPLCYVFMCGFMIKIFEFLGNANLGLYILSLLHGFSMMLSFSLIFVYLKKWNIHYKYRIFLILFFCINPIFCNYALTIYHDVIYSSFFVVYVLLLTDIVVEKNLSKKKLIGMSLLALCICLTRKNGIYVVIPTQLFVFLKYKLVRPKILLLLPILLFYTSEYVFSLYYYKTSVLEALTIPIQTVARYAKEYPNDITEEEKEKVNQFINYDRAGILYNPTLVDDVRNNTGNYRLTNEDLKRFFPVWVKLFFRHPTVYLEAVINITYQLYYPFEKTTYLFFDLMDNKNYYSIVKFSEVSFLQPAKNILKNIAKTYEKIPIVKYFDDPGFYIWLFFLLLVLLYKNKLEVLPIIPLFMTFLCCLAGPAIDYHGRYVFPILFTLFYLYAFYSKIYNQKK